MASAGKGERKRQRTRSRRAASNSGAGPSPPPRFKLYGLGDLRDLPQRDPLVEGLIDRETLTALIGEPGSAKSAIALYLGLCIATGRPFAGRAVRQGAVCYIAAEGQRGLPGRIEALCKRLSIVPNRNIFFCFMLANLNLRSVDMKGVNKDVTGVIAALRGWPFVLVIIDTLSATFGAGEENSSADMMQYIANVRRIMEELGCAVLLVHHVPKYPYGRVQPRGHSSLSGNCETVLLCTKQAKAKDQVTLSAEKERDMQASGALYFKLEGVKLDQLGDDGEPQEAVCAVALADTRGQHTAFLTGHALIAYKLFCELATASGAGQKAHVRVSTWRAAFCKSFSKAGHKADTPKREFRRALATLQQLGIITVSGDEARLVD